MEAVSAVRSAEDVMCSSARKETSRPRAKWLDVEGITGNGGIISQYVRIRYLLLAYREGGTPDPPRKSN